MDLVIIGESPSRTRPPGMENVNFSGRTSHILWDELKKYNITREDCFITNIVDKLLPRSQKPTREMIAAERIRLQREIDENNPLLILAVGKIAAEAMINGPISVIDSAGDILESKRYNRWVVPCIHPSAVTRNKSLKLQFENCIWMAAHALEEIRIYERKRHKKQHEKLL